MSWFFWGGLMLLFLGTQQWKCFKCWPLYFCLVHATRLVHPSFLLLIVYKSLLLSFRVPMRLSGPLFCKYCCYGLSNSFFFFCSHQPFGRNEKLKFPSKIPYHQEVCVNSTHTLAFGTRNSLLSKIQFVFWLDQLIPPNGTLTFGEYSERLVNKYYQTTT